MAEKRDDDDHDGRKTTGNGTKAMVPADVLAMLERIEPAMESVLNALSSARMVQSQAWRDIRRALEHDEPEPYPLPSS
jgi:hypothetical protein